MSMADTIWTAEAVVQQVLEGHGLFGKRAVKTTKFLVARLREYGMSDDEIKATFQEGE